MKIEITNLTSKRISAKFVKKVVWETLKQSATGPGPFEVSVVCVENKEIRRLNRIYRKKNKSTDVLSFRFDLEYNKRRKEGIEGELILCPEIIEKDAKKNKVSFDRELAFVLSHGVLHLLGMRHSKKMFELQDKVIMQIRE